MLAVSNALRTLHATDPKKLASRVTEYLAAHVHPDTIRAALAELPPGADVTAAGKLVEANDE